MKTVIALNVMLVAISLVAKTTELKRTQTPQEREEIKQRALIRRGGEKVAKPGTQKGVIDIVNCQSLAKDEWIEVELSAIRKMTNLKLMSKRGEFKFPDPQLSGNMTIFIIDDKSMPNVLVAPENLWAMMNVSPLKGCDETFFRARMCKELSRTFAMLCGGMTSMNGLSLMGAITKPEDLDVFPSPAIPMDVLLRMPRYLEKYEITPAVMKLYRIACQEGWGEKPTNAVQKAIWDEVHATPKNPMKIEFDSMEGR